MRYAEITGWGKCLPPAVMTNEQLSRFVDTSDEWIRTRTGIEARRISHVNTSELAEIAAQRALDCADVPAAEIDLLIVATASPDTLVPNIASKIQHTLGASRAAALDVNAACTGFVYCLEIASKMVQSGAYQHALVIGAERLSYYLDWTARESCVLFGDGAGAVVLSASEHKCGLLAARLGCDPEAREILAIPNFGTARPRFGLPEGNFEMQFVGKEIFKRAVKGMGGAAEAVLADAGIDKSQLALVIPHQANLRIIETLCHRLEVPLDKAMINIQHYGNTSAATIPIALCEALEQNRIKPGDFLLMAAFGAGLTWGACVLQWGQRTQPRKLSSAELPATDQSAEALIGAAIEACKRLKQAQ